MRSILQKIREVPSLPIYHNQSGAPPPHQMDTPATGRYKPSAHITIREKCRCTSQLECNSNSRSLQQRRATLELEWRPLLQLEISPPEHPHQRVKHPHITIRSHCDEQTGANHATTKEDSHCHNQTVASCILLLRKYPLHITIREEPPPEHFEKSTLPQLKRSPTTTTKEKPLCHKQRGVCKGDLERSRPTTNKEWTSTETRVKPHAAPRQEPACILLLESIFSTAV